MNSVEMEILFMFCSVCLFEALVADELAVKLDEVLGSCAENTFILILLHDDAAAFNINTHLVARLYFELTSDFDRENNSAQFVNFSCVTANFHNLYLRVVNVRENLPREISQ